MKDIQVDRFRLFFTKGNSIAGGLVDPSFKGATIIVVGFETNFSY
jgi:hypothetical protein